MIETFRGLLSLFFLVEVGDMGSSEGGGESELELDTTNPEGLVV